MKPTESEKLAVLVRAWNKVLKVYGLEVVNSDISDDGEVIWSVREWTEYGSGDQHFTAREPDYCRWDDAESHMRWAYVVITRHLLDEGLVNW